MEKNKELLQEFFFKKKEKISDKMKKKYGYEPLDARKEGQPGFGSIISPSETGLAVTDSKEAGKRVVSALGASLGVNSVKNIASKSIKSFPIIVSDNIEPETSVMLKRVLEEQYAEYISLLISNQVVDITAFKTSSDEGNIAVQAIGKIAADDESVQSKIAKGKVDPEDLLGNLTAFNLIRNESYKTNNALLDTLLEGAFIVPSEEADNLLEFYHRNFEDIVVLNETDQQEEKGKKSSSDNPKAVPIEDFLMKYSGLEEDKIKKAKEGFDALRGLTKNFKKVSNPEYTKWNDHLTSLDNRIKELELEIKRNRERLLRSDEKEDQRVARAEQAVRAAELRLQQEIVKRRALSSNPKATSEQKELKDLDIAYARDAVSRAQMSADPREPQGLIASIEIAEDQLGMLNVERERHMLLEPESKEIEVFNRLTTPRVLLDKSQMDVAMNSSIGEILLEPKNSFIRDRFEKATFLLESNRIAGVEYIEYLVQRLGIPLSADVRRTLSLNFRIEDIVDPTSKTGMITKKDIERIKNNSLIVKKMVTKIAEPSGRTMLTAVLLGSASAAGTAALTGSLTTALSVPPSLAAIAASAPLLFTPAFIGVGVAAITALVAAMFKRRAKVITKSKGKIEGWERVESLIEAIDDQQQSLRRVGIKMLKSPEEEQRDDEVIRGSEFKKVIDDYSDRMAKILNIKLSDSQKTTTTNEHFLPIFDITASNLVESLQESVSLNESINADEDYKAAALQEAVIQTTIPQTLELKYEYDPKKAPEILAAPKFSTRDQYAYATVEYDKRELKDRRFNAPLLMKVSFRERFSDGTFADNELVAVIGILGVVTRVPSSEMEYILKSNAEGDTVKGILAPEGDPSKLVADMLGIEKIKKDVKNLPISSDTWEKLEKISRLAVANKLAGRKDNNIANAHIVFAQKEIDNVRADEGIDYMKNIKLAANLMKRYSAFTVMIANDVSERLYIFDDLKAVNWDVAPYSALRNKDTGDQLSSMLNKLSSGRL